MLCNFSHYVILMFVFFFFKQKTAYEMRISDWSSDVCSSDLWNRLTDNAGNWRRMLSGVLGRSSPAVIASPRKGRGDPGRSRANDGLLRRCAPRNDDMG